jgi:hypothetical protein
MVTMVLPTPSSEIMPKHDEDMGGTGEKYIGGQLELVRIYSTQRPNKKHTIIHYKTQFFGSKRARQRPEE